MGRNDRLSPSCTEAGERERKHAVDRVGRNDRLSQGSGEEVRKREGKISKESARDRVGRNDRLSPGSGRKRMSMQKKGGGKAGKGL